MAKNQPSYSTPSSTQLSELRELAKRGDCFFPIGTSEIPSIFPERLREKLDSAVVIVSGSTGPNGAMAVIGHRIDRKDGMMDHDPFLIQISASGPYGNGIFIHHPSFPDRSVPLPCDFNLSTTTNYFRDHPPFGLSSGSTGQLPASLFQAFDIARRALGSISSS